MEMYICFLFFLYDELSYFMVGASDKTDKSD